MTTTNNLITNNWHLDKTLISIQGDNLCHPEIRKKTKLVWDINKHFHETVNTYHYPKDNLNHSYKTLMIFLYTLIDRVSDLFYLLIGKSNYFNQKKEEIYSETSNEPILTSSEKIKIHNIGHATMFIQTKGLNILTDPVFDHLNSFFYRRKTVPGKKLEELPEINAILISHNHRDHMEISTLQKLVKKNPNLIIIVPLGERQRMESLGFKKENIQELDWWQKVTIIGSEDQKKIEIAAVPCRHWSNRSPFDANESLFNGYIITPKEDKNEKSIYFAGDSAKLDDMDLESIGKQFNIAYNIQPSGPNFPRKYMQGTHQSTLDAIRTHFFLGDINKNFRNNQPIKTILMHHRAYRLGPDKVNETQKIMGLFYQSFWGTKNDESNWMVKEESYLYLNEKMSKDSTCQKNFQTNILNPKIGDMIEE